MRGAFIALYGINNIGKSTQTKLLLQRLLAAGVRVEYIKFPIYSLDPTGTKLNEILRGKKENRGIQSMIEFFPGTTVRKPGVKPKNTLFTYKSIAPKKNRQTISEHELQMWYSLNRYQYDSTLRAKLDAGISILAEDYIGTGLAWGAAKGGDAAWLAEVNKYLTQPDIEILMDGERFATGREANHLHESSDRLIEKARAEFKKYGKKYGWQIVPANRAVEEVAGDIWGLVEPLIRRKREVAEPWIPAPAEPRRLLGE